MIRKSQATRDHTRVNNLTLISISRFSMKHVLPPGGLQHPPPPPPQILGNSDILGSKRDLGRPNFYKNFHVSFRIFFSLKELLFILFWKKSRKGT